MCKGKERKVRSSIKRLGNDGKCDVAKNSDAIQQAIDRYYNSERNRNLFPLRINSNTVIFVSKKKCTPQYAEEYLRKISEIK